jgi:hypothetical protein
MLISWSSLLYNIVCYFAGENIVETETLQRCDNFLQHCGLGVRGENYMVYMIAGLHPSGQSSAILLYITHSFYTTVQKNAVHTFIPVSHVITKSCTNYEILSKLGYDWQMK